MYRDTAGGYARATPGSCTTLRHRSVRPGATGAKSLGAAVLAALFAACTSSPDVPGIHDWEMRERLRLVEVGQSLADAHAVLRRDPVIKPGHPDDPFPSPLRTLTLHAPGGERVRVELYVVATRPAPGCPDVHYRDVPVVFVDGAVAAKDWEFVEWRWREWGGSLAELRDAQDRFRCPQDPAPAPASP